MTALETLSVKNFTDIDLFVDERKRGEIYNNTKTQFYPKISQSLRFFEMTKYRFLPSAQKSIYFREIPCLLSLWKHSTKR